MKKDKTEVVDINIIKKKDTTIKVGDLIKALKEYKDKKLSINMWILEKEGYGKTLIGDSEIWCGVNEKGTFMLTLIIEEEDLEENDINLELWKVEK